MNVNDLLYLLEHPEAIRNTDKASLDQLSKDHPYFSTAYFLSAKRSQLHKDSNFETKLNLASAYAVDRIKLFEFMNAAMEQFLPVTVPLEQHEESTKPAVEQTNNNTDLDNLLQSIHEKKKLILSKNSNIDVDSAERDGEILRELRGAGSEFSAPWTGSSEAEPVDAGIDDAELHMLQDLEQKIEEQVSLFIKDDFAAINEVAGDGEYAPLHELLSEESEVPYAEEHDPEIESIAVIEEEFVLRDLDQDLKLYELDIVAKAENPIQLSPENPDMPDIPADSELEALRTVEEALAGLNTLQKEQELQSINDTAGGGSEFSPLTIAEEPEISGQVKSPGENESIWQLENIADQDPASTEISSTRDDQPAEETTLTFTEHVPFPGAFLPGKSYSFRDWLQFFKPEAAVKQEKPALIRQEQSAPEMAINSESIAEMVLPGDELREEAARIDQIVATLRHEHTDKPELQLSPADLARKSLEMDDSLLSETLAGIYEEQGLLDKAIHMYARLSLKFPEKSLFFAARIKELKSKK